MSHSCFRFSQIQWPDGLNESKFLADYWQRKPLLIRQALPEFETPLPADELAGLSLEPGTAPRIITQDRNGAFHLEHGPFAAERFATLTGNDWSLLVTDVEKHVPALAKYLQPFAFLPNWRIDDLMISYAPVGASVGAHVDEYDVFLLQASGRRRWSIDSCMNNDAELLDNSALKLLANFSPSDTWDLRAGDILYLPPGVPHHGVASGEPCTTWSIGFRAPTQADIVMRMAEMISASLPHSRYTDGLLKPAVPGELDDQAIARFIDIWLEAINQDREKLASLVGRLLSDSTRDNTGMDFDFAGEPDSYTDPSHEDEEVDLTEEAHDYTEESNWCLTPFSRAVWRSIAAEIPASDNDEPKVELYIDGETYVCSRQIAVDLGQIGAIIDPDDKRYSRADREVLQRLMDTGSLRQYDQLTPQ